MLTPLVQHVTHTHTHIHYVIIPMMSKIKTVFQALTSRLGKGKKKTEVVKGEH